MFDETMVQCLWGHKGAPWELNLRDITRWCDLLLRYQVCSADTLFLCLYCRLHGLLSMVLRVKIELLISQFCFRVEEPKMGFLDVAFLASLTVIFTSFLLDLG